MSCCCCWNSCIGWDGIKGKAPPIAIGIGGGGGGAGKAMLLPAAAELPHVVLPPRCLPAPPLWPADGLAAAIPPPAPDEAALPAPVEVTVPAAPPFLLPLLPFRRAAFAVLLARLLGVSQLWPLLTELLWALLVPAPPPPCSALCRAAAIARFARLSRCELEVPLVAVVCDAVPFASSAFVSGLMALSLVHVLLHVLLVMFEEEARELVWSVLVAVLELW